jgi:hypothetical protein
MAKVPIGEVDNDGKTTAADWLHGNRHFNVRPGIKPMASLVPSPAQRVQQCLSDTYCGHQNSRQLPPIYPG